LRALAQQLPYINTFWIKLVGEYMYNFQVIHVTKIQGVATTS